MTAVLLPGSGSDDVFVRTAFAAPLRAAGVALHAPVPRRGRDVVAGYRTALDGALDRADGPLLVGGVSLGAHVAARWAARAGAGRVAGLLLVLPAWGDDPAAAPAALAARFTAVLMRRDGLDAAVASARSGAPAWLADELARAWAGHGPALPDALDAAATEPGPSPDELRGLDVPAGVVGLSGDAVHPLAEARRWAELLPRATLVTSTLDAFGADPAVLGRAAVRGWAAARDREAGPDRDGAR
ncbi:alpha/beta hydrolase [Pseudonocardia abyssalis]|uniref:Alpha/beta hydrolase n=1 Tax=Pseudonocardia abyssalis TaxID=2792008 RepID=A0ABS6UQR3_9PSEU|nr:alpha/beta hydrolase [Pseudonocardia abyssalis]MBW0134611.1 alpha/beta hydrolase [Pseudonocardia abyssalis]